MARYPNLSQGAEAPIGVLLLNLGTPDAPTPKAVRRYLAEFLSDPRVIELPHPLRWLVLHGFILRTRPHLAARTYSKIWTEEGSPLLAIATKQAKVLQEVLEQRLARSVNVVLAMRYGNPSIKTALEQFRAIHTHRLLIFPLYPQYSAPTTASAFDAVVSVLKTWRRLPEIRMVMGYHDDEGYLRALANRIRSAWETQGRGQRLLFSFHGLPEDSLKAGDPYFAQCHQTARLVAARLQLEEGGWAVAFQSRFGLKAWLKPYTDETLKAWARAKVESVDVICPGFSADCLETLEEINIRNRRLFIEAGGKHFHYIPALNDSPEHIELLAHLVINHVQGWAELAQPIAY